MVAGTLGGNQVILYGGGQVPNPANVIVNQYSSSAPSTGLIGTKIGTIYINSVGTAYMCVKSTGSLVTWDQIGLSTGTVGSLTGDSGTALPSGGSIKIAGTANQISSIASGSTVTLSLIGPYTPTTYTAHGVLIGEGTSSIVASAVGATGQVLSGNTGADPTWINLPAFNIVDNTSGTVASPTPIVVSTKYIADAASATTGFILPSTAAIGQSFSIIGNGPGGWQVQQNSGQSIKLSGQTTTTGTGSVSSETRYDCATFTCVVAGTSTVWNISEVTGNLVLV